MAWVAGVDGCRAGWIVAARHLESGARRFEIVADAAQLLAWTPPLAVVGIDVPIGLPAAGRRRCDEVARELLGWPRRNSVFPAPIRAAIGASSREAASRITERADGRRVGAQAFAIYPKIREVEALLEREPKARRLLREVHPEVSFREWNGGRAFVAGKKSTEGRSQRLRLAERWLGRGVLAEARGARLRKEVGDDDLLDAIAALWTATRIARGEARTLPEEPLRDARGRRMEIVY